MDRLLVGARHLLHSHICTLKKANLHRSTRWNPNCWTAAGYVAVMINPTGSTGYGQDFVDAIHQNVRKRSR